MAECGLNAESGELQILECPSSAVELKIKIKPGVYRVRVLFSKLYTNQLDEFEGGFGAEVAYVSSKEHKIQSIQLRSLYRTMYQGEGFLVLPVPKDKEPDAEKQPTPVLVPLPKLNPRVTIPGLRILMEMFLPIFDPTLFNDFDRYNKQQNSGDS